LIDTRLMQQFLDSRDTKAPKKEVDEQVNRIRDAAKQRGSDPDKVLAELGYTPQSLREEFALPIAWKHHVDRAVTGAQAQNVFSKSTAPSSTGRKCGPAGFSSTRLGKRMPTGKLPKATAECGTSSQAIDVRAGGPRQLAGPQQRTGGDVGEFPYVGRCPPNFRAKPFRLDVGEISQPFRTPYGMELCLVDRPPAELSLEDVRDDVLTACRRTCGSSDCRQARREIDWKVESRRRDKCRSRMTKANDV